MTAKTFLIEYWPIILTVIGLGVTWIKMQGIDKDHEKRITTLEVRVEDMTPVWVEIKERLASIEATLKFLTKEK